MALTPQQRVLRARLGAHALHAKVGNESAHTAPARKAFDQRFLDAAGGDAVKAEHLRREHFLRLALASSKARAARKAAAAVPVTAPVPDDPPVPPPA